MMGKRQRAAMRVTVDRQTSTGAEALENQVVINYDPSPEEHPQAEMGSLPEEDVVAAVQSGVHAALSCGPIAQFPVQNARVKVDNIQLDLTTSKMVLHTCAAEAVKKALQPQQGEQASVFLNSAQLAQRSPCTLLEPIMNVALTVPRSYMGAVMADLKGTRAATILDTEAHADEELSGRLSLRPEEAYDVDESRLRQLESIRERFLQTMDNLRTKSYHTQSQSSSLPDLSSSHAEQTLQVQAPLSSMLGYSKALRALTKGHGKFSMSLHGYGPMSRDRVEAVLKDMRGF
jgi:elongation factor G